MDQTPQRPQKHINMPTIINYQKNVNDLQEKPDLSTFYLNSSPLVHDYDNNNSMSTSSSLYWMKKTPETNRNQLPNELLASPFHLFACNLSPLTNSHFYRQRGLDESLIR